MEGLLPRKLRVLRAERGLTVRQAAALTGVAKETISELERGARHPLDATLAKLARGYEVGLEELMDLEEAALSGKAEASSETGHAPAQRRDFSLEEQERTRRYLRVVQLFASRMDKLWTVAVDRDNFSKEEFEQGAQLFLDFESAYVEGVGTDLLGALRNGDVTLPEVEREALDNAKSSLDEWHRTLWSAYARLQTRGVDDVRFMDNFRRRTTAWVSADLPATPRRARDTG